MRRGDSSSTRTAADPFITSRPRSMASWPPRPSASARKSSLACARCHERDIASEISRARQKAPTTQLEPKMTDTPRESKQLLHIVFGGELENLESAVFKDPSKIDVVGIFPNYASAHAAWKSKAQSTVDNAHMRYFIVHLHRFLDPA